MASLHATLHVYVGPMFSGKTGKLLKKLTKYADITASNPLLINHTADQRVQIASVSSHSSQFKKVSEKITTTSAAKLENVDATNYNVIGIDEAQFFPDLYEQVKKWLGEGKKIICAGLDGDANMETFGQTEKMVHLADKFVKMRAICAKCHAADGTWVKAPFTIKFLGDKDAQIESGGSEKYMPVCRRHFVPYLGELRSPP